MIRSAALIALVASTLANAAAYASVFLPGPVPNWAPWALALGTATVMVAIMVLGAGKHGRIGRLIYPFAFVFLLLAGGFAAALALSPARGPDAELWLGLPTGAAIVLYGIGLLPLFVIPIAYAWTFDELTLSDADIQRVREMTRESRTEAIR